MVKNEIDKNLDKVLAEKNNIRDAIEEQGGTVDCDLASYAPAIRSLKTGIDVDDYLGLDSINPVQNKVITAKINEVENKIDLNTKSIENNKTELNTKADANNTYTKIEVDNKVMDEQLRAMQAEKDLKFDITDVREETSREINTFEDAVTNQIASIDFIDNYGTIINAPDDEDITSINDKLKFKDRVPNFDGMGYKILRKGEGLTFANQVTEENTIYEIRYDFDLNNAEVNIPDNCVLKFNGGSLNNGIINGNNYQIESPKTKIFDDIVFKGNSAKNLIYKLDWFTNEYLTELKNGILNIDSSIHINNALNSGIKNLEFPNDKYYYLKNPIVVNGYINLLSETTTYNLDSNYRVPVGHYPCIFSNEIDTLLEYNYFSDEQKHSITIGKIQFYCRKPYTDLSNINIPIVKITSTSGTIWGLTFDANINALDCQVDVGNMRKIYIPSHTGLSLNVGGGSMTFIRINGYIQYCYYGITADKDSTLGEGWMTDIAIHGDSRCVIGGVFKCGNPVRIYGTHQPIEDTNDRINNRGYFEGEWMNFYGFVWDLGVSQSEGLHTVKYNLKFTSPYYKHNKYSGSSQTDGALLYPIEFTSLKNFAGTNWLNLYFSPKQLQKPFLKIDCTLDGVDIRNYKEFKLFNINNLFNFDNPVINGRDYWYNMTSARTFLQPNATKNVVFKLDFIIDSNYLSYSEKHLNLEFGGKTYFSDAHILIQKETNDSAEIIMDKDISKEHFYSVASGFITRISMDSGFTKYHFIFTSILELSSSGLLCPLPILRLKPSREIVFHNHYDSDARPLFTDFLDNIGFQYFDTTLNKPIWWTGTDWVDANGQIV